MRQYKELVSHVLKNGTLKHNRTGTDTIGVFGYFYKHHARDGFPLLTTKEMRWDHIVLENLWFLSGDTDVSFLRHYNIKFWEPWTDASGKVPSAYGNFWRKFPNSKDQSFIDQIDFAVHELRNNPLSRRIVITAWDPANALSSNLPPCHLTWVLNTQKDREGDLCLNLALFQRSCDIALGVPYNLAGYSFLLHLIAHLTHLKVGEFAHSLVDAHIYVNHLEALRKQNTRLCKTLPRLCISNAIKELADVELLIASKPGIADIMNVFRLDNYNAHPPIAYQVAV